MLLDYKGNKSFRLLSIYERLQNGEYLGKSELATNYSVTEKTIQRDIDDLRAYLIETHIFDRSISIKYDKVLNKYYLSKSEYNVLSKDEILTVCKIILENSSLSKNKVTEIIQKMLYMLPISDKNLIYKAISSDLDSYSPILNSNDITLKIWDFTKYSQYNTALFLSYNFPNNIQRHYLVNPINVTYKNNMFLLVAYSKENNYFPIVFNIGEITNQKPVPSKIMTNTKNDLIFDFKIDKENTNFEVKNVTFEYTGNFPALLTKFPTAELLDEHQGVYKIHSLYSHTSSLEWLKNNQNTNIIYNA